MTLDASDNRTACYRCHPGSTTRCLRGAMGSAVATDGDAGDAVPELPRHHERGRRRRRARAGSTSRPARTATPAPRRQQRPDPLHDASSSTTATRARRSTDASPPTPTRRPRASRSTASRPATAACSARPATARRTRSTRRPRATTTCRASTLQGHAGTLVECTACHDETPETDNGGPHGMHPIGQSWVDDHEDAAEQGGIQACQACHGTDYRGTVLSHSQADWTATTEFGDKHFWRGFHIGCYACHNGPDDEDPNPNHPAEVADARGHDRSETAVDVTLRGHRPRRRSARAAHREPAPAARWASPGTTRRTTRTAGFAGSRRVHLRRVGRPIDSNLATVSVTVEGCPECLFEDGFESGDTSAWSRAVPDGSGLSRAAAARRRPSRRAAPWLAGHRPGGRERRSRG